MKKCEKCDFYIKFLDEEFILHNDTLVEGKEDDKLHYCPLFKEPIQADIFYGNKECDKFYPKNN